MQTPSQKPFFRVQGVSKREDLMKNGEVKFIYQIHKSNAFSDEKVKIKNGDELKAVENCE